MDTVGIYQNTMAVNNIPCNIIQYGGIRDLDYCVIFKRSDASIEDIEAIDWNNVTYTDSCPLKAGFGYKVTKIDYDMNAKAYNVYLKLGDQYLGDVTRYQAEIATKDETISTMTSEHAAAIAEKDSTITSLNAQLAEADETILAMNTQLEEADEAMLALYEQMNAESTDQPVATDVPTAEPAVDEATN